ncbi:MAG: inositol-3-phosphate synthase [Acidobacteria bacterium RBG_16_68_9]|nr:MAG: inositol-3-phosphate synthase [Acidobacteria bacterium RBG_16_68_9]
MERGAEIAPATGPLGILLPGLGAVSTTFIAGVELVKKEVGKPIGSLSQLGTIRLGKRTDNRSPFIKDFVPLADLGDLVFGAWDIFPDDAYQSAAKAGVLDRSSLDLVRVELEAIQPWPAVFVPEYVKRLTGTHVKQGANKLDLAQQIMADIEGFRRRTGAQRLVMAWCGSTESFLRPTRVHESLARFEEGLKANDPAIAPSMLYAYAALSMGIPFANGAPNLTIDIPALVELAQARKVPICGKDFKTGQTLMKTILAPGLKARMLGVEGWFSTNILGNRDGEVLDEPSSFRTKEESKLSVLDVIFRKDLHPELYGDYVHLVNINYYRPRGDNKEGWDNIDIFGWLGYPMQIKINFLCRDSILAAPLVLDLALFLDLAQRAGMHGVQEWLSFYFKSPQTVPGLYPEHDLFIQLMKLKNSPRYLRGEELITHLGLEYYD